MQRFLVLRDKAGNWERPPVTLQAVAAPKWPGAPGEPVIDVVENSRETLASLSRNPQLLFVTPIMATRMIAPEPLDALRPEDSQPGWGIRAIAADRTPFTGQGTRLALLDTGIDAQHPAFEGVTLTTRDFVGTGIGDANGHGTHLAGTVLGRDQGGTRIGVARGVTDLLVAKAVTDEGRGTSDALMHALLWAAQAGASVVGFALRFDVQAEAETLLMQGYPERLCQATAMTAYRGNLRMLETALLMLGGNAPLVLAAIGNDCLRTIAPDLIAGPSAPAAARGVLAVGAVGEDSGLLQTSPFSNSGPALVAPGEGIASAQPGGGLRVLNGSSMAMAHAMGAAALWAEKLRAEGGPVNAHALAAKLVAEASTQGIAPESTLFEHGCGLIRAPLEQQR